MIFGTPVQNAISRAFIFFDLLGRGSKRTKHGPKWQKILSVMLHISETIHHMIFIYGTRVLNENISNDFFHFLKILILQVFKGVKGQKIVQNDKKFCLLCSISQEPQVYTSVVHKCKMIISPSVFLIFWFFGLGRTKGMKWPKIMRNSACCALFVRNHIS